MKKIIFILIICTTSCADRDNMMLNNGIETIRTVEIQGCEYISYQASGGLWQFTHKGNCKHCIERNKK